ncbi:MAG: sigma-70 family RNA polymerase sigma factor [Phycisphaerales bacterium]|nr:sigma-70 family RNA polymerase sigma factor [Phycisphaerales bacterium]
MSTNPPTSSLSTRTTTRLLDALKDHSNEPAWGQMDARYRPVVAGLARRLGATSAEAEEVAQQTLAEFVQAYRLGRYDRGKGRLSSWILGIARNTTLGLVRKRRREGVGGLGGDVAGDASIVDAADEATLRRVWTDERDRVILLRALGTLRDESAIDDRTLTAFELVALRGVPAAEVAAQCGMSVDQVYVARSRVTKSLRAKVQQMTDAFEEDA